MFIAIQVAKLKNKIPSNTKIPGGESNDSNSNAQSEKSIMPFTYFLFTILICSASQLRAQVSQPGASDPHDHEDRHHDHHHNEIGIAAAPVYFVKEEAVSFGLHFHYIRNIGETKFGLGAGFERIFDEHGHNTFGLLACYRPVHNLSFILSPGITLEDAEPGEPHFALHAETAYEFVINDLHLGPVLEFAYDPEDFHISLGLHVGFGF